MVVAAGVLAAVVSTGIGWASAKHSAPSSAHYVATSRWTPSRDEVDAANKWLWRAAEAGNPEVTLQDADVTAPALLTWPANVTSVEMVPTDRQTALTLLSSPGAVEGDGHVMLYQITGTFVLEECRHRGESPR